MMPKKAVVVAMMLVLMACHQAPIRDEASYQSRIGVGSTFVLHETLIVPTGHARVFLQRGKVIEKVRLDRYRTHCNFEVRSVSDGSLNINPDTFLVTEVDEDEEEVVGRPGPQRYAALGVDSGSDGTGITMIARYVRHWLYSERQPEVMRLTCHGGFDFPFYARTPSIAEIREALGQRVTLNLVRADE